MVLTEKVNMKFYTFKQGHPVPKWLMNWESESHVSEFYNSRKGKITFGMSCIGIRVEGCNTALIQTRPLRDGECLIHVVGIDNCKLGGVNGASGCFIVEDNYLQKMHELYEDHINARK